MEIVVRAAVMYIVLLCLLRAMGRRELSELTTFDLLITVVIGDLIQQGVTQEDMSFTGGLLAVGTMCLLAVASSYVGMRSRRAATRARRRSGGDRPQRRALRRGHASRAHHENRADGGRARRAGGRPREDRPGGGGGRRSLLVPPGRSRLVPGSSNEPALDRSNRRRVASERPSTTPGGNHAARSCRPSRARPAGRGGRSAARGADAGGGAGAVQGARRTRRRGAAVASVAERDVGGVPALVVTPNGDGPFPVLVWIHGGGWVIGSAVGIAGDRSRPRSRRRLHRGVARLPARSGAQGAGRARRLHRGDTVGARPRRLSSAATRDRSRWAATRQAATSPRSSPSSSATGLRYQVLVYPAVDLSMSGDYPSLDENADGYLLDEVGDAMVRRSLPRRLAGSPPTTSACRR